MDALTTTALTKRYGHRELPIHPPEFYREVARVKYKGNPLVYFELLLNRDGE